MTYLRIRKWVGKEILTVELRTAKPWDEVIDVVAEAMFDERPIGGPELPKEKRD